MKNKAALILALLLVLSLGLSACGKTAGNTSNGASNTNNAQPPEPPVTAESLIKGFADKTGSGTGVIQHGACHEDVCLRHGAEPVRQHGRPA